MRCFRKLLGISYRDHIANEEVKTRIGNAIGPYGDLLTSVKRCKLKWYGHVTRSSGLAILQGTVQGGRWRGRQRKGWEDNIKEWTSLEWNSTLWKAENREEWRKLVVKSTVVPQQSARLGDRWSWISLLLYLCHLCLHLLYAYDLKLIEQCRISSAIFSMFLDHNWSHEHPEPTGDIGKSWWPLSCGLYPGCCQSARLWLPTG